MNSLIRDELVLMMNVFGSIEDDEQIKIISDCSKILDNDEYKSTLSTKINEILVSPDFELSIDFSRLILLVIQHNHNYDFYKNLNISRMKIILYGILYSCLIKSEEAVLAKLEITKLRLIYFNSIELLLLHKDELKIEASRCLSSGCNCLGINLFSSGKKSL